MKPLHHLQQESEDAVESPPTGALVALDAAAPLGAAPQFVDVDCDGRAVRIEHQWLNGERADAALLVFLHEGLGSLSMWRDFPQQLCDAAGCRGLVYSRPGYGRSTPRARGESWGADYMHRQACALLPALLSALKVDRVAPPPWLFGHSDGGSIALLYAARHPDRVAGCIVVAPHIMVEALSIEGVSDARAAYLHSGLRARLAKYHEDPDSAFWGWNEVWLDPRFLAWSIEAELAAIRCPLLAVQGLDDVYGSVAQIRGIARRAPQSVLLELAGCGHSPHRDQPAQLIAACTAFLQRHGRAGKMPHGRSRSNPTDRSA